MMIKGVKVLIILLLGSFYVNGQVVLSEEQFEAEGIKKVIVEGSFIKVFLAGSDGNKVSVDGKIEGPKKYKGDISIKTDLDGSTLTVWVERPNSVYGNINGELRVSIPRGTEIEGSSSSGSLKASNLEGESIDLRCSSGSLIADHLTGNVILKTSSGSLRASDIVGNTVARTSSGSLKISRLRGNLEARTSSGRLSLIDVSDGEIAGRTSSGGISLENVTGKLSMESTSGSIKGDDVKLTGDSDFEASSGTISLYIENDIDNMSFDLKSSSGGLRVGDRRKSDDRLVIERGGISLRGRTSSGSISIR